MAEPGASQSAQDDSLDLYPEGTVGAELRRIDREARNTTEKGEALELLFREIAQADPALDVECIDLYTNWARKRNDPHFSTQDKGIDLVAKLNDGTHVGIQCKYYDQKRPIRKGDVNSFLAKLAARPGGKPFFQHGWIVSTTKLAKGLDKELYAVGVHDLSIWKWGDLPLRTGHQFPKRSPRPYQTVAIESLKEGLPRAHGRRGQLVMACGTGKTFTALRAMEELVEPGGRVLVCAPTIALVSQLRAEWLRQTNVKIDARVVCSDAGAGKSRDKNEPLLAIQALECPVTTSSEELAKFLKLDSSDAIKVVFTTYQSLVRVKEAQEDTDVPNFDLAIADEAHKTVGSRRGDEEVSGFLMIHEESLIRACMRLYMTATPKVYSNAKSLQTQGYSVTDWTTTTSTATRSTATTSRLP